MKNEEGAIAFAPGARWRHAAEARALSPS